MCVQTVAAPFFYFLYGESFEEKAEIAIARYATAK